MITESRKREPSAKICKQIDKLRQASCRVRPLAVGTITKKDRRKPVRRSSGYRCIQILCDAGRYPSGIAVSRKREPSARICRQIDERRQASCRVRPLAVGTITKKDRFSPVFFVMVPLVGVEPTRYRYHGILSPARLPIPPQRHILS